MVPNARPNKFNPRSILPPNYKTEGLYNKGSIFSTGRTHTQHGSNRRSDSICLISTSSLKHSLKFKFSGIKKQTIFHTKVNLKFVNKIIYTDIKLVCINFWIRVKNFDITWRIFCYIFYRVTSTSDSCSCARDSEMTDDSGKRQRFMSLKNQRLFSRRPCVKNKWLEQLRSVILLTICNVSFTRQGARFSHK